jgi:hypothetical protein
MTAANPQTPKAMTTMRSGCVRRQIRVAVSPAQMKMET